MIVTIPTRHEEITLVIKVFTHEPHSIRIKVVDAENLVLLSLIDIKLLMVKVFFL